MPIAVSESVRLAQDVSGARAAPPTPLARIHRALRAPIRVLRPLALSLAVWILYMPHYAVLWLLGPRYGLAWARLAARGHWLLTFVGAQRSTRRALEHFHPMVGSSCSVSTLLRKHLEMKHECFARVRVYHHHGAESLGDAIQWIVHPNSPGRMPKIKDRDNGLLLAGFHFGFYQMLAPILSQVAPGGHAVQLRLSVAHRADQTIGSVQRLISRRALEADRRSGASILYVAARIPVFELFDILRDAGGIAVAVDGMLSDGFIEVPFFDGVLQVPDGWARLAAITHSDVLVVCDQQIDGKLRHCWLFDNIECREKTDATAYRAAAQAIAVLERMIRLQPWAWHPWPRLRWHTDSDGRRHYCLKRFGQDSPPRSDVRDVSGRLDREPDGHGQGAAAQADYSAALG